MGEGTGHMAIQLSTEKKTQQKRKEGKKQQEIEEEEDEIISVCHKNVNLSLIKRGDELTDEEINALQALLRKRFQTGGLQDCLLGAIHKSNPVDRVCSRRTEGWF